MSFPEWNAGELLRGSWQRSQNQIDRIETITV